MGAELFLPTPDLSGQTATLEQATNALQAQGGLEQHTNRYGADPSQCPFLASMGAAGIELAAQLEASKNDPHRGPTLAELWAAEEAQQATQAVKQATTDEAIALFSAAASAKPRESEPVAVVSEVSVPTNTQAEQHHLAVLRANQTINQLLSEMDGFVQNEGIIIIGATNRKEGFTFYIVLLL